MIWHGMGDFASSPGMTYIAGLVEDNTEEGTVVHVLQTGEGILGDILSGFLKNANQQVKGERKADSVYQKKKSLGGD